MKVLSVWNRITTRLYRRSILRVSAQKTGATVTCEQGLLWLTQSGDATDYVIKAGEQFTLLPGRGEVLIQAMRDSSLRLARPQRSLFRQLAPLAHSRAV